MKHESSFRYAVNFGLSLVVAAFFSSCEKQEIARAANATNPAANENAGGRFSDNEHIISEETAAEYIGRFTAAYPNMETRVFWSKLAVRNILAQPHVDGVRYYHGQTTSGMSELYLVAVNKEYDDILTGNISGSQSSVLLSERYTSEINWQAGQSVTLENAAAATARHRQTFPDVARAGTFNKEGIELLLIKNPVFGVLSQHGMNENNQWVIILRSLDKNGKIMPGFIIEASVICPPDCGKPNVLNGRQ